MNTSRAALASVLLGTLIAAKAPCQGPFDALAPLAQGDVPADQNPAAPQALSLGIVDIHRPTYDGVPDAALWAATDSYKVSFARQVTFVPYLGKDYPHNQQFGWTTQSVQIGGRELSIGNEPRITAESRRCELHWQGMLEAYDVRAEGLEQTFVFTERPAGEGDLVLRGAVATALGAQADGLHAPVVFRDAAGTPILSYGRATAVDARGARFAMTSSYENGVLCLRLPASDLAAAEFPLVVDPILARQPLFGVSGLGPVELDLGYETATSSLRGFVCYSVYASAQDSDVFGVMGTPAFNNNATVFSDLSSAWSATHPRCAFIGGVSKWILAYETYVPGSDLSRLRVHLHNAATYTASSSSIGLLNALGVHDTRPDVGGTVAGSTGSSALLVFQRDNTGAGFGNSSTSQVMGMLFDASTTSGVWGIPFVIGGSAATDNERPSVNSESEGGAASSWVCVFQQYNNTIAGDDWDLIGKRIDAGGTVASGQWISDVGTRHQLGPVVGGSSGRYAVLFTTVEATVGKVQDIAGKELRLERFDWASGDAAPSVAGNQPNVTLRSSTSRVWEATGIAFDRETQSHWELGFRLLSASFPTAYAARVGYHGELTEAPGLAYFQGNQVSEVAVAYDGRERNCRLAYAAFEPNGTPIYLQEVDYPVASPIVLAGSSCSGHALVWEIAGQPALPDNLAQQIGNEFTTLRVTTVGAPDEVHFAAVSLATDDLPIVDPVVPASCRLLVSMSSGAYLGMLPIAIGGAPSWQLSLPEFLPAMTLHFQDWVISPSLGLVRSTPRLSVPLVK